VTFRSQASRGKRQRQESPAAVTHTATFLNTDLFGSQSPGFSRKPLPELQPGELRVPPVRRCPPLGNAGCLQRVKLRRGHATHRAKRCK